MPKPESRRDRINRLKGKFHTIGKLRRLQEYIRYDCAKTGKLAHPFPKEYVEDCAHALWELLKEDYKDDPNKLQKTLDFLRGRPLKPFIVD